MDLLFIQMTKSKPMKTQKNYRYQIHDGDSCKVHSDLNYEDHLIEDHPQKQIEDHPRKLIEDHHIAEAPVAAAAAPVEEAPEIAAVGAPVEGGTSSHWWAWCVAALAGLCIVAAGLYYGFRNDNDLVKGDKYAYSVSGSDAAKASSSQGAAISGEASGKENVVDYVYYFGNDKSAVIDNENLEQMADKIEDTGADVVVTAYASQVGNEAYNKVLSEKRANNIAGYLIAHGVPRSHVKVVSSGETTNYGDEAHNRRANIHVVYPGQG